MLLRDWLYVQMITQKQGTREVAHIKQWRVDVAQCVQPHLGLGISTT